MLSKFGIVIIITLYVQHKFNSLEQYSESTKVAFAYLSKVGHRLVAAGSMAPRNEIPRGCCTIMFVFPFTSIGSLAFYTRTKFKHNSSDDVVIHINNNKPFYSTLGQRPLPQFLNFYHVRIMRHILIRWLAENFCLDIKKSKATSRH